VGQFSGIIEIMKGVDQGYGGAGYAALSFLLAVYLSALLDFANSTFF
jgi:cobalamin synthase